MSYYNMWSNLVNQASSLASQAAAQASNLSEQIQKEIETSIEQSKAQSQASENSTNKNNNISSASPLDPMSGTCPSLDSGDPAATNSKNNEQQISNSDSNQNQTTNSTIDPTLPPETVEKMTKQADEVADKIINFASNWAGKAMTVASDVGALTQEKIKEAQESGLAANLKAQTKIVANQALEISSKVGDQVTNQVGQINEIIENKTIIGDFNKHQKQQIQDNLASTGASSGEENGCPWEGYEDFEILKEQILNLSKDKRTFVRNPPAGVTFNFEYQKSAKQAVSMLSEDENLKKMRFELVPKQMKEENFWRNYFYRVSLMKQSFNLKQMSKSTNSLKTTSSNPDENKNETAIPMTDLKINNSKKVSKEPENEEDHHDDQFVSTDFNNEITADDLEAEMKALGMDGNEAGTNGADHNNNDDEDWEKELNQELAEYEVVDEADGADTQDTSEWEKEVNDMLG